jgi:uncharacterized protein with HEPN domain
MQRDLAVYLIDIQQCLEELAVFVKSKTLSDYQHEAMLRRAIEREFTIIGEVMRRILHHFPESAARIEDARKIANFRNVIVHEYNLLDDAQIWNIATDAAPVLKLQIDRWLGELDQA